jgi:hypothetical protein
MNAVTKAVLAFLLFFTITFLCSHYLPGLNRFTLRYREPLSTNESVWGAVMLGIVGALIILKKRN